MTEETQIEVYPKPQSHLIPKDWKARFLELFANTGNKTFSAIQAGVTVRTVYNHIENDSEFAMDVEIAKQNAIMVLHGVAWSRAVGTPVIDEETGDIIGHDNVDSRMLIFLMSSMSPDDYGHGAIKAEERRNMVADGKAQIIINLPENFRGEFTMGVKDVFPDASEVINAKFSDVDKEESGDVIHNRERLNSGEEVSEMES